MLIIADLHYMNKPEFAYNVGGWVKKWQKYAYVIKVCPVTH